MSIAYNFTTIYRQFGRRVLGLILKRNGGDLQAAEDIVQDTFVAALKSFHTFHKKSTFFTWLCRVAINKMADYYRDQVGHSSSLLPDTLPSLELSPEERLGLDELRVALSHCLNLLPTEYRQLLQLKYYQELTSRAICIQLHLSPRQLEGKLYRARHKLAKIFTVYNESHVRNSESSLPYHHLRREDDSC